MCAMMWLTRVNDIYAVTLKAAAVEQFLKVPDATKNIQAFVRVANIARKTDSTEINPALMTLDAEQVLYRAFEAVKVAAEELIAKKDFIGALDILKKLAAPIDGYFDSVMVMDENLDVRKNRLAQLKAVDNLITQIADFKAVVI